MVAQAFLPVLGFRGRITYATQARMPMLRPRGLAHLESFAGIGTRRGLTLRGSKFVLAEQHDETGRIRARDSSAGHKFERNSPTQVDRPLNSNFNLRSNRDCVLGRNQETAPRHVDRLAVTSQ